MFHFEVALFSPAFSSLHFLKNPALKKKVNKLVLIQHFLLYLRTQSTLYILPYLHPLIQAPAMLLSAFYLLFIDFDTRMDALEITWGWDML